MGNNDKPLGMSGGVPAGWVLVPVEPTEAMRVASAKASIGYESPNRYQIEDAWSAMLAATPTPPIEGRDADVERETVASDEHDCWDGPLWTAFIKDADAIRAALQALGERG